MFVIVYVWCTVRVCDFSGRLLLAARWYLLVRRTFNKVFVPSGYSRYHCRSLGFFSDNVLRKAWVQGGCLRVVTHYQRCVRGMAAVAGIIEVSSGNGTDRVPFAPVVTNGTVGRKAEGADPHGATGIVTNFAYSVL